MIWFIQIITLKLVKSGCFTATHKANVCSLRLEEAWGSVDGRCTCRRSGPGRAALSSGLLRAGRDQTKCTRGHLRLTWSSANRSTDRWRQLPSVVQWDRLFDTDYLESEIWGEKWRLRRGPGLDWGLGLEVRGRQCRVIRVLLKNGWDIPCSGVADCDLCDGRVRMFWSVSPSVITSRNFSSGSSG